MSEAAPWMWLVFAAAAGTLLALDLIVYRRERRHTRREAALWSGVWIGAGLAFNGFVWFALGGQAAQEYLAAWLLEESLSLDNLFVFLVIFRSLAIPPRLQHRVLFWGVFGAIVFRAVFIVVGAAVLERYVWVSYLFGATMLYAAWRAYRQDPGGERKSRLAAWLSRRLPVTPALHGREFVVRANGGYRATPLLLALIAIEATDIVFAIDSIPAALSVTQNVFVLYSANVFAVLGLRALYLLLARTIVDFRYLHYALAAILAFAALKLIGSSWVHVPPLASVAVIVGAIALAVLFSVRARRAGRRSGSPAGGEGGRREVETR